MKPKDNMTAISTDHDTSTFKRIMSGVASIGLIATMSTAVPNAYADDTVTSQIQGPTVESIMPNYKDEDDQLDWIDSHQPDPEVTPVYRVYNPKTGLHHYTSWFPEAYYLSKNYWKYEGIAFIQPSSGTPVYRAYNKATGNHHWTSSKKEYDYLTSHGWRAEGIAWYTGGHGSKDVYRVYNPNTGEHLYTTSIDEYNHLTSYRGGWKAEGVAWESVA